MAATRRDKQWERPPRPSRAPGASAAAVPENLGTRIAAANPTGGFFEVPMAVLVGLVEFVFLAFGCWTLAYHAALLLGLPARLVWIPFLVASLPILTAAVIGTRRCATPRGKTSQWPLAGTVALSLSAGLFTLVTSRPDQDDFSFFHRALVQPSRMDHPFVTASTGYDVEGLPPLSGLHAAHVLRAADGARRRVVLRRPPLVLPEHRGLRHRNVVHDRAGRLVPTSRTATGGVARRRGCCTDFPALRRDPTPLLRECLAGPTLAG